MFRINKLLLISFLFYNCNSYAIINNRFVYRNIKTKNLYFGSNIEKEPIIDLKISKNRTKKIKTNNILIKSINPPFFVSRLAYLKWCIILTIPIIIFIATIYPNLNFPYIITPEKNLYIESPTESLSCLNKIYDEIFIISVPWRINTLSVSIYQLKQENIKFTIWKGHSPLNNYSYNLWTNFRKQIDERHINKYKSKVNSAYHNKAIFFLRESQLDIMRYAKLNNLSKILIFEDDILIANTKWINLFCKFESYIPEWNILTLGQNEGHPLKLKLIDINNTENINTDLKYYHRKRSSWGAFALSISYPMYSLFLDIFNMNNSIQIPLDNSFKLLSPEIRKKFIGIHPTLIIPDVVFSTDLRKNEGELPYLQDWIKRRTTLKNNDTKKYFSKYWNLRFSLNLNKSMSKVTLYKFDELIKDSPSNLYLHK